MEYFLVLTEFYSLYMIYQFLMDLRFLGFPPALEAEIYSISLYMIYMCLVDLRFRGFFLFLETGDSFHLVCCLVFLVTKT